MQEHQNLPKYIKDAIYKNIWERIQAGCPLNEAEQRWLLKAGKSGDGEDDKKKVFEGTDTRDLKRLLRNAKNN